MKLPQPIVIVFFLHALVQGGMFSRIPDMQLALGLNEAELGIALLGQPAGAIVTFLFASLIVEKLGTRILILTTIPMLGLLLIGIALAPNLIAMWLGFAVFGAAFALSNISINVEADRVEAATARRLMNTCHGIWSVGLLTSSLIGTAMRGANVAPALHFAIVLVPVLIGMALFAWPMRPAPERPHSAAKGFRITLPTTMTLLLVGYAIAASLLEGGLRNWSVIFMRDSFVAPDWVDTLTLPAFMTAQSIGRLLGDRGVTRWGPVRLARALTLTSVVGLLLVVFSPNLIVALAGFTLIGFGVCVSFPLSTSAAARLGDRPASENVAALTMSQQMLLLFAPALMGWIATVASIRVTFAVLLPPLLLAFYLARYLAPRKV